VAAAGAAGAAATAGAARVTAVPATQCVVCPAGKFQPRAGTGGCPQCSPAKYQDVPAATSCLLCQSLPPGIGSDCGRPETSFNTSGRVWLTACSPGERRLANGTCLACGRGSYSFQLNAPRCLACPAGKHQPAAGLAYCLSCAPGSVSAANGSWSCVECAAQTFQPAVGASACLPCLPCAAGSKQACGRSSEGHCTDCMPGRAVNASHPTRACFLCAAGRFTSMLNAANCSTCPGGKYQNEPGQMLCNDVTLQQFVRVNPLTGEEEAQDCPKPVASGHGLGATCEGGQLNERAGFWRDAQYGVVSRLTKYYYCPMATSCLGGANCSDGYAGPMCAVCRRGYAKRLGKCAKCPTGEGTMDVVIWVASIVFACLVVLCMVGYRGGVIKKVRKMAVSKRAKTLFKVTVGFYTLVGCMDFTFGVPWPPVFAKFLGVMKLLTLDLSQLSGFLCNIKGLDFYDTLYSGTVSVFVVVCGFMAGAAFFQRRQDEAERAERAGAELKERAVEKCAKKVRRCKKGAFYILIFLYPLLNLRIFQAFVCEEVSGVSYLRCDFSVRCHTDEWYAAAVYCGVLMGVYTLGFPVVLYMYLRRNEAQITHAGETMTAEEQQLQPFYREAGFLYNDYRHEVGKRHANCTVTHSDCTTTHSLPPADYRLQFYWWEVVELVRKLMLSSILLLMERGNPWQVSGYQRAVIEPFESLQRAGI
jgi:hypothetical protein